MRVFKYTYLEDDGSTGEDTLNAIDRSTALRQLDAQKRIVVELSEHEEKIKKSKYSSEEVLQFFIELQTLLCSGVAIAEAVRSLVSGYQQSGLLVYIDSIYSDLQKGVSFSTALKESGLKVPVYFYHLATAGEASGKLGDSLGAAVDRFKADQEFTAELKSALIYPSILICSGIGAVFLMFLVVVPKFTDLLKNATDLPFLASVVMSSGAFFNDNVLFVLLVMLLMIVGVIYAATNQRIKDALLSKAFSFPLFKQWLIESESGRWTGLLSALLGSGVPIIAAVKLSNEVVALKSRRVRFQKVIESIGSGNALTDALKENRLLLPTAYSVLSVGEKTGRLPEMLNSLSELYAKKSSARLKRLLALIEPLAVLTIGGVIGVIMLGIIQAITSVSDVAL